MDQLISILPGLELWRLPVAVGVIALITVGNLRGLRESGNIFAIPTYLFVGMALIIVASGVAHIVSGTVVPLPRQPEAVPYGAEALTIVLILRAFASGSVALTGVEAIANGVPGVQAARVAQRIQHAGGDGGPAGRPSSSASRSSRGPTTSCRRCRCRADRP